MFRATKKKKEGKFHLETSLDSRHLFPRTETGDTDMKYSCC